MSLEKCRTCSNDLEPPEILIRLDTIDLLCSISIGVKLGQCVPELELNTTKEKICKSCLNLLTTAYNFRKMCLQTEATLKNKNFDANTSNIKSEPPEVFVPINVIKTEMNAEEHVVHDLTEEESIPRSSEVHTFGGDVITGDISVGFEITNAKQIHNTVSVSFTTNSEKSCRFQAEKSSDLQIQNKSKQVNNTSEALGAQSHLTLDTNLQQCKSGLSDVEIVANYLKRCPSLRHKNITNAAVALNKLPRGVLVSLLHSNHKVYTCTFCDILSTNRRRLRNHKVKHLNNFKCAKLENQETSKVKRKRTRSPPRPRQEKRIKTEMEAVVENEMPVLEPISLDIIPLESHASSPLLLPIDHIDADHKKPEKKVFVAKKSTSKINVKTKGGGKWNAMKIANIKPSKDTKPIPKSPVDKQKLCGSIKTEALQPKEKVMKCEFCDITFCSSNMFNLHMSLHPNENKQIPDATRHVCEICQTSFNTRFQLNGHMSVHSRKRLSKNQLKTNTDSSKKPAQSKAVPPPKKSQANKKTDTTPEESINLKNSNSSLGKNLRNIQCKTCDRKFSTVYHYNVHLCLKTDETHKIFKCEVCRDHFCGRNAFLEHVKSHLNGFTH